MKLGRNVTWMVFNISLRYSRWLLGKLHRPYGIMKKNIYPETRNLNPNCTLVYIR